MAGAGDVPEELLCPLTHELLIDPVMTEDGHTYERAVLERWLSSHKPQQRSAHRTVVADPIRAGRVAPTTLPRPNVLVRGMCRTWSEMCVVRR